jgi:hypothetical protein
VLIFARGMISAGLEGMPRRIFRAQATYNNPAWDLGGIADRHRRHDDVRRRHALLPGDRDDARRGPRRREAMDVPVSETLTAPALKGWERSLDRLGFWVVAAVVLILIAYGPFFLTYQPLVRVAGVPLLLTAELRLRRRGGRRRVRRRGGDRRRLAGVGRLGVLEAGRGVALAAGASEQQGQEQRTRWVKGVAPHRSLRGRGLRVPRVRFRFRQAPSQRHGSGAALRARFDSLAPAARDPDIPPGRLLRWRVAAGRTRTLRPSAR